MIYLFTGSIGSGKSYHTVAHVLVPMLKKMVKAIETNDPKLEHNIRKIYHNLEGFGSDDSLNYLSILLNFDKDLLSELIYDVSEVPKTEIYEKLDKGSILVLDEVQNIFGASLSTKDQESYEPFFKALTRTRHFGIECYFITQHADNITSKLRRLVTYERTFKKLGALGASNKYHYKTYDGIKKGLGIKSIEERIIIKSYEKRFFPVYKSYVNGGLAQYDQHKEGSLLKQPKIIATAMLFVCVLFYIFSNATSVLYALGMKKEKTSVMAKYKNPKKEKPQMEETESNFFFSCGKQELSLN